MRDPYEVLGVSKTATADEIKSAYRKLARRYHPDVNPGDAEAEERFKEIGNAYEILGDAEKRARFDQFGTTEGMPQDPFFGGAGAGGIQDIFDMFFGGMGGASQGRRSPARDGGDFEVQVLLDLKEVLTGVSKEVEVSRYEVCDECAGNGTADGSPPESCGNCRGSGVVTATRQTFMGAMRTQTPCPTCGGQGFAIPRPCGGCKGRGVKLQKVMVSMNIPAGVETGARLHLPGAGHKGIRGGRPGDLYAEMVVKMPKGMQREGQTLYMEKTITFVQAALGDSIDIAGVDDDHEVEIPAGTQPGDQLALRGLGMPPLYGGRRGDLVLGIQVEVPKSLNDEQKRLLLEFAQASGQAAPKPSEDGGGFLGHLFGKKK